MAIPNQVLKVLSLVASLAYFNTNALFGYSVEFGFWSERKKAAREKRGGGMLLTSLPGPREGREGTFGLLPSMERHVLASTPDQLRHLPLLRTHEDILKAFPLNVATIRDISLPDKMTPTTPLVIHVQDVHHNLDAQLKISRLIRALTERKEHSVDLIALEGAWETINPAPFRFFSDKAPVQRTMDHLLRENEISGPVYAACIGTGPFPPLVGVDDAIHHSSNAKAYRQAVPEMARVQSALRDQRAVLDKQKPTVFSPELLRLDTAVEAYHSGTSSLGRYVEALAAHSPAIAPAVAEFKRALDLEKSMDFPRVERERSEILTALVQGLDKQGREALLAQTLAHRAGRLGYADFYRGLESLCAKAGVTLDRFPEFRRYIRYAFITDGINAEKLFRDLNLLERRVFADLSRTPASAALVEKSRANRLFEKLTEFSLTPTEWKEYGEIKGRTAVPHDLKPFETFYEEASVRDGFMAENLFQALRSRAQAGSPHAPLAVLVTGGFHSPGLTERLNASGVAVVSVVPKIEKIDSSQGSHYLSVFSREKTPLEKLFSGEKLFLATPPAAGIYEAPFWIGLLNRSPQTAKSLYDALRHPVRLDNVQMDGDKLVATFKNAASIEFTQNGEKWETQLDPSSRFVANFWKPLRELPLSLRAHMSTKAMMRFMESHLPHLGLMGNREQIEKILKDWLSGIQVWFSVGSFAGLVATGFIVALFPLAPWFWFPVLVAMVLLFHYASHVLYNIFHPRSRLAIEDIFFKVAEFMEWAATERIKNPDNKFSKLMREAIGDGLAPANKQSIWGVDASYAEVTWENRETILAGARADLATKGRDPNSLTQSEGRLVIKIFVEGMTPLSSVFRAIGLLSASLKRSSLVGFAMWLERNARRLGLIGLVWEIPNLLHTAGATLPAFFDHGLFQILPVMDPLGLSLFLVAFWTLHQLLLVLELAQGIRARAGPVNTETLWTAWRQAVPPRVALLSFLAFVPYLPIPFLAVVSAIPWWVLILPAVPHLIWDLLQRPTMNEEDRSVMQAAQEISGILDNVKIEFDGILSDLSKEQTNEEQLENIVSRLREIQNKVSFPVQGLNEPIPALYKTLTKGGPLRRFDLINGVSMFSLYLYQGFLKGGEKRAVEVITQCQAKLEGVNNGLKRLLRSGRIQYNTFPSGDGDQEVRYVVLDHFNPSPKAKKKILKGLVNSLVAADAGNRVSDEVRNLNHLLRDMPLDRDISSMDGPEILKRLDAFTFSPIFLSLQAGFQAAMRKKFPGGFSVERARVAVQNLVGEDESARATAQSLEKELEGRDGLVAIISTESESKLSELVEKFTKAAKGKPILWVAETEILKTQLNNRVGNTAVVRTDNRLIDRAEGFQVVSGNVLEKLVNPDHASPWNVSSFAVALPKRSQIDLTTVLDNSILKMADFFVLDEFLNGIALKFEHLRSIDRVARRLVTDA